MTDQNNAIPFELERWRVTPNNRGQNGSLSWTASMPTPSIS